MFINSILFWTYCREVFWDACPIQLIWRLSTTWRCCFRLTVRIIFFTFRLGCFGFTPSMYFRIFFGINLTKNILYTIIYMTLLVTGKHGKCFHPYKQNHNISCACTMVLKMLSYLLYHILYSIGQYHKVLWHFTYM